MENLPRGNKNHEYTERKYPVEYRNKYSTLRAGIIGAGQVYQKRMGPSLHFLGVKDRLIFDPNLNEDVLGQNDQRINNLDSITSDRITYVLSPNSQHVPETKVLVENQVPVFVEKPIAINAGQISELDKVVAETKVPIYFSDYYLFKALGLFSLMGIKMPFKDHLRIEHDPDGKLADAIRTGKPILDKIVRVKGYLLEGGQTSAATIEGREWLEDLKQGGGMLLDLMVHLTNISNMLGLKIGSIKSVRLASHKEGSLGEYKPIQKNDWKTAEDFAHIKAVTLDGVPADYIVGKFAREHNRYILLEDSKGYKLRLAFNADNSVEWINPQERVVGRVILLADPYVLTVIHSMEHFVSNKNATMFYEPQRASVLVIEEMQRTGRS